MFPHLKMSSPSPTPSSFYRAYSKIEITFFTEKYILRESQLIKSLTFPNKLTTVKENHKQNLMSFRTITTVHTYLLLFAIYKDIGGKNYGKEITVHISASKDFSHKVFMLNSGLMHSACNISLMSSLHGQ